MIQKAKLKRRLETAREEVHALHEENKELRRALSGVAEQAANMFRHIKNTHVPPGADKVARLMENCAERVELTYTNYIDRIDAR